MAEGATDPSSPAEQARLRKERREAKIKAGGSARLSKITGMGGRVVGDSFDATATATAKTAAGAQPVAADPEEVDISQHYYAPRTTQRRDERPLETQPSEAELRHMMLGLDRSSTPGLGGAPAEQDALAQLMSQMMGSSGLGPGASPFAGIPSPMMQAQQPPGPDAYTTLFRLVHAIVGLGLGLYVIMVTPFTGTRLEREREALAATSSLGYATELEHHRRFFFWLFASAETILLSTRFLLDKGRTPPPGMLWTLLGYLPEPWKGYLGVGLRYGQIFTTVRADILACMFVMGVCAWYRS
ncbi:hypothetical protein CDD82_4334 [Ophiocordyceps australis]|uniref:GET complex subunit GET2 n=1 Tax=Ophiocordyceps australis TaxID=1399860 RepID=A0A2C5ZSU2_9HYPO|nr:hypothetical protein CDD82_4334 [Ophiocordyceps australis]